MKILREWGRKERISNHSNGDNREEYMMTLSREGLKNVLLDSYGLVVCTQLKRTYEIESRTKIKSLIEGLRQFDEADKAVLHFVKYAEYYLPRSKLHRMLDVLLETVGRIQQRTERSEDYEDVREQIQYLIGYTCWSMDALCEIFKECDRNGKDVEKHVKRMIETEFGVIGASDRVDATVDKIMNWHASARSGR